MTLSFVLIDLCEDASLLGIAAPRPSSANWLIGVGLISAAKSLVLLVAVIASAVGLLISLQLSRDSSNSYVAILGNSGGDACSRYASTSLWPVSCS